MYGDHRVGFGRVRCSRRFLFPSSNRSCHHPDPIADPCTLEVSSEGPTESMLNDMVAFQIDLV